MSHPSTDPRSRSGRRHLTVLAGLAMLSAALFLALRFTQALPDGPQPVAWDWEACAHCRMHLGDPSFAVQLQTTDGEVLNFDDPGCLFEYEAKHRPSIHALYFRDLRQDRWLPRDRAAFIPVDVTPMGYGLGAVEVGTETAMPYAAAAKRALAITRNSKGDEHGPQ